MILKNTVSIPIIISDTNINVKVKEGPGLNDILFGKDEHIASKLTGGKQNEQS